MRNNKSRLVFFNEKFIPENEAKVSIYDSALMFGDMIFEMTRSFKGKQRSIIEILSGCPRIWKTGYN